MAESTGIKDADNNVVPVATDVVSINGEEVVVQRTKGGYGAEGAYADMDEKPATEEAQERQDDTLDLILRVLNALNSKIPMQTGLLQFPVRLESGNNAAVNINQWGGQTPATGVGAGGNGAPRVTPSNDTVAGNQQTLALLQSFDVRNFRNRITT